MKVFSDHEGFKKAEMLGKKKASNKNKTKHLSKYKLQSGFWSPRFDHLLYRDYRYRKGLLYSAGLNNVKKCKTPDAVKKGISLHLITSSKFIILVIIKEIQMCPLCRLIKFVSSDTADCSEMDICPRT